MCWSIPGTPRSTRPSGPTHFLYDGELTVWLHLARPNPVWAALAERARVLLTVVAGDRTRPAVSRCGGPAAPR